MCKNPVALTPSGAPCPAVRGENSGREVPGRRKVQSTQASPHHGAQCDWQQMGTCNYLQDLLLTGTYKYLYTLFTPFPCPVAEVSPNQAGSG